MLTMRPRETVQLVGVLAGAGVVVRSLISWGAWIALVIVAGLTTAGLWQWARARQRQSDASDLLLGYMMLAVVGFLAITELAVSPARECLEQLSGR